MKEAVGAPHANPASGVIRFGSFEMDKRSGELRRKGIKVKLSAQPFDVLVALVEKPGQVVTREELHEKLWSQNTFVDFEHGLNKAINKVREALGDNADNPRFIETLPRRGYRFLAPVTAAAQPDAPVAVGAFPARDQVSGLPNVAPAPERRWRLWPWAAAIAAFVVLGAVITFLSLPARPPRVLRVTQLTHDGLRKAQDSLTFLPATDGSRVYFSEDVSGANTIITQVSVTGGPVSTLAALPSHLGEFNSGVLALDYSSVRSELLVYGRALSPLFSLSLPGGSAPRRIGDYSVNGAAWAPDGQSIVISSRDTLYRVKADGSDIRKLATVPGNPMFPRWSPDGKKIVFSIDAWNDLPSPLWEIDADGTNPRLALPGMQNETEIYPAWSAGGKYLIYAVLLPGNDVQLFAVQQETGIWHRQAKPVQLTSGPLSFNAPTIGPDGKTIYALGSLNQGELMRFDRQHAAMDAVPLWNFRRRCGFFA